MWRAFAQNWSQYQSKQERQAPTEVIVLLSTLLSVWSEISQGSEIEEWGIKEQKSHSHWKPQNWLQAKFREQVQFANTIAIQWHKSTFKRYNSGPGKETVCAKQDVSAANTKGQTIPSVPRKYYEVTLRMTTWRSLNLILLPQLFNPWMVNVASMKFSVSNIN